MGNFTATLYKIFNKKSKYDKTSKIFLNGEDNQYPNKVESGIVNSVTAFRCAALMASFISGKGFGDDANKIITNPKKGTTLLRFTQNVAKSISKHRGAFIHFNFDGNYKIKDFRVLPFDDCRVGKKDDDSYSGKILICEDWTDNKKVKAAKEIDVFNPNEEILKAQVKAAGSFENYKGQVYFLNLDDDLMYPLAPIHPCLFDAESERLSSVYKHTSLKKGFFGKTLIVTKPLTNSFETDPEEIEKQKTEAKEFKKTIQSFVGAENSDGALHLEMEFTGDEIDKQILFKNIDSNINDKLFAFTEDSVADNIRMCFNNVPAALISAADHSLFGASGEAFAQMRSFYQDQTSDERLIVEQLINEIFKHYKEPKTDLKIIPLYDVNNEGNNKPAPGNFESGKGRQN